MHKFDENQEIQGNIFNWTKIGQQFQGTYVGRTQKYTARFNKTLWLYDFKLESGEIISVWGRPLIDSRMKFIKLGQIVEMRYDSDKPSNKGNDMKYIRVFADPTLVDAEWLKLQEEEAMLEDLAKGSNVPTPTSPVDNFNFSSSKDTLPEPFPTKPTPVATPVIDDNQKLSLINDLSKIKLGVNNVDAVALEVMNAINLAFVPLNYDAIITKLEALPDKK